MKRTLPLLARLLADPSAVILIASNVAVIALALSDGWSFGTVLAIYFVQSVVIGAFTVLKALTRKEVSFEGATILGRSLTDANGGRLAAACFFGLHFSIFHIGYGFLIFGLELLGPVQIEDVCVGGAIFFLNHLISFAYGHFHDKGPIYFAKVAALSYLRIIPVHLSLLLLGQSGLPVFMALKTVMDVLAHELEHARPPSLAAPLSFPGSVAK